MLRVPRPFGLAGGVLLVLLIAGAGMTLLLKPAGEAPSSARVGAPAPRIALPVVGGGRSDLAADRGKVVLVNFWATWCEPCKAEMPALQALANDLHDQPFRLYSVDLQEEAGQVRAFEAEHALDLYALLDDSGEVTRAYNVRALPSSFLIDKSGVLRQQRLGALATGGRDTAWSPDWLDDQVRALLATG